MNTVTERRMRPWMKIFVSALILLFSLRSYSSCDFHKDVKKVISLSGPMTVALQKSNLLFHKKVAGISVFSPVDGKNYHGKVYPGGLFLAHTTLNEFSDAIVFYDQGAQIRRVLTSRQDIKGIEIKTRDLLPLEVVKLTIDELKKITQGCENEFSTFYSKALDVQKKLLEKIPLEMKAVFYLGPERSHRLPELVIANDGVPKLLIKERKLKTYPSELAYVNWSAKLLSELPKDTLHVIIEDPAMKNEKKIKRSSLRMTLIYPGSLVPGISQLEAFLFFANSL